MNKEYQHSEIIDAYLRNELSAAERADFEQLVRQDPLLYNEFVLQQEVVAGLQSYRKAQLKSRLNQIDVSNTTSWTGAGSATAWIGGVLFVSLLSWSGYNYFGHKMQPEPTPAAATEVIMPVANVTEETSITGNSIESDTETKTNASADTNTPIEKNATAKQPSHSTSKNSGSSLLTYTAPVAPDTEVVPGLQEESLKKADVEPVTDKLPVYGNTSATVNRLNVIDNTNESLKLHYYYRNGRIALLGFDKPYTFLDMPSENITYLHYGGDFYKLNSNQIHPAPIQGVLVTDETLKDSLSKMLVERK